MPSFTRPNSSQLIGLLAGVLMLMTAMLIACSFRRNSESLLPGDQRGCPEAPPSIDETASTLGACLSAEIPTDKVARLLESWGRIDPGEWGGVTSHNVLPSTGDELLVTYHAYLREVIWNPAGKVAVLQRDTGGWSVIFESPTPGDLRLDGQDSLEGNWSFHFLTASDVTGDGLDDLLISQQWSNGTHGYVSSTKLVTAEGAADGQLRFILLEDSSDIDPRYQIVDETVLSTLIIGAAEAVERSYQLDGETFSMIGQSINPDAAKSSVTMANGAVWYAFDTDNGSLRRHAYGLYRIMEEDLFHLPVPYFITALERLGNGQLYVAGNGEKVQ